MIDKPITLLDVCELIVDCPHTTAQDEGFGTPLIRTPNIGRGYFILEGVHRISEEVYQERIARAEPRAGDIIFAREAPAGNCAIIRSGQKMCLGQRTVLIRPDDKKIDPRYLCYLLLSPKQQHRLLCGATGSTVTHVNMPSIRGLEIDSIPPLPVQRRIAAVLGALDDKIELNRKMNANLEAQAQALFKSWFVDFEPFGGKMPKEWKMGCLLDVADYTNGLAMQKYRPKDGDLGLPVLKIKELHQGYVDDASERCQSNLPGSVVVDDGDVVFSWSGTLLVELWCGGRVGLNQHLFKVTSDKFDKWFYFMWTKHHKERFAAIAKAFATTMGHIKRGELQKAEVVIPDRETISSMTKKAGPLIDMIIQNNIESRKLAETRDALLPKLMSGELEVNFG